MEAARIIRELNDIDTEISISGEFVNMASTQIDLLHSMDDGYITIAVKRDKQWIQYHYKAEDLKSNIGKVLSVEGVNIYISPNSFYKPFRKIENIRKLNSLYIDLDYYTVESLKGLSSEQIIWLLEKDYFKVTVPEPSFLVITGRGIAIYWLIEPVPYKVLPLWNALQKHLLSKLIDIGADSKSIDSARVMRLSGSINQKNNNVAGIHLYDTDYRYSLKELQEGYLPQLTPYVKNPCHRSKGRRAKVVSFYTLYSLHYARLRDLVKLLELRNGYCRNANGELINTGQREFMCFLYRYWSCCYAQDSEKAIEDTLGFNNTFAMPLHEKEVIKQTKSAEKAYTKWLDDSPNGVYSRGGYNYKNVTLIEKLCITVEEMLQLETIIDKKEVKRRNNERKKETQKAKFRNENGLTKREQAKKDKIQEIKKLREQGLKLKEIAMELKVSVKTVEKYLYCK